MKAILKDGVFLPKEPVPPDWPEGTELDVQKLSNGAAEIETRFHRLKAQWRADTFVLSDPNKIMGHPAMQAIIAMGEDVVPIILSDLRDASSVLVWALPKITGENLAPPKVEGGFVKWNNETETEAWLNWGRANGML